MNEMKDIICRNCGSRHGPAAKECECGQSLIIEESPAPPHVFFILSVFLAAITIWSARAAEESGYVYFPIGGILFTSVAFTLGFKSWFWNLRNRQK